MINTLTAFTPPRNPSVTPRPAERQIDLSDIDTAEKAVMLPLLNPVTMHSMRATFDNGEAVHKGTSASLNLFVDNIGTFGIHYYAEAKQPFELNGMGMIAHTGLQERRTYDDREGALRVDGQIGNSAENLKITQKEDGIYDTHIDGRVGTQDVHLTIHHEDYGYSWDGTIGSAKVHEEVRIDYNPDNSQDVHVRGSIGDTPIVMDGHVVRGENGASFAHGQGSVGSIPVQYSHQDHGWN